MAETACLSRSRGSEYVARAQLARKETAVAAAAVARFPDGSALRLERDAAEAAWGRALAAAGREWGDAALLAVAAEAFMNVSPWDYYMVCPSTGFWYPTLYMRSVCNAGPVATCAMVK